jgi:glycosyltransferase involved in cell wall biosynthesis
MDARWEGTLLPSKLQASFAVGVPVIYVGDPNRGVARWVTESGGGWVVAQDDVAGMLDAVAHASHRAEREKRGGAALRYALEHFDRVRNVERLIALFCGT